MCDKYNGWTNKPTWSIALWLADDQSQHNFLVETAGRYFSDDLLTGAGKIARFSEFIKAYIEEQSPVADESSMWNDIVGWTLAITDWRELAESYFATAEDYAEHDA